MTRQQPKTPPLLSGIAETVDEPEFRHWVEDDYPEDDRDDGINFFRGLINGLLLTALFVAVGYGFWIITS